jgi:hypothetical protein
MNATTLTLADNHAQTSTPLGRSPVVTTPWFPREWNTASTRQEKVEYLLTDLSQLHLIDHD